MRVLVVGPTGNAYVVVAAREGFAVGATSRQIDLLSLLLLMVNDKRGIEHRDESDAEM